MLTVESIYHLLIEFGQATKIVCNGSDYSGVEVYKNQQIAAQNFLFFFALVLLSTKIISLDVDMELHIEMRVELSLRTICFILNSFTIDMRE